VIDWLRETIRRLLPGGRTTSFQAVLEHELRDGDAVCLHVTNLERSLGRSNPLSAGSESPAASRTKL